MKKFLEEAFKFFWIPVIMAVVSYIFFTLKDITLGIIVLIALSAAYTLIRLYYTYKKWWLLIILVVVLGASVGAFFFRAPTISLTINDQKISGAENGISGGKVLVSPAPSNGLYTKGTIVTLTAVPGSGQDFKSWVGTANDNTNPTTVKMEASKHIRVNFESRYSLIINNQAVIGSMLQFTEGSVSVSPAPDSDGKYTAGTIVNLSVHTNTGYDLKNWTGTANDNSNPTTVVMTGGNKNVNVDFEGRFTLTIGGNLVIGSSVTLNTGSVTVNPSPGNDDKYAYGTKITLTATPDTGYGWKNWNGTSSDGANPAVVTINSDKHVNVIFEERYLVVINNKPFKTSTLDITGGTITSDPAPGTDNRYVRNSITQLIAVPATGYRFDKWSGDVSDTVTAISVIMDSNKSISATFIRIYHLVTGVNINGSGTISPAQGTYDTGEQITITAAPADGYRFDKWTGGITGSSTSTTIIFSSDVTATANFVKVWKVTLLADPANGGIISPASGTYDDGTVLQIVATPAEGYSFSGWDGLSDNATSQNVTISKDMTITAKFELVPVSSNSTGP